MGEEYKADMLVILEILGLMPHVSSDKEFSNDLWYKFINKLIERTP